MEGRLPAGRVANPPDGGAGADEMLLDEVDKLKVGPAARRVESDEPGQHLSGISHLGFPIPVQPGLCIRNCAITVAKMKVPALAASDVTTMRQPSARKVGISLASDSPA